MFYNSLQYSGTKTVGLRNCIICTNHALAQSIPPGPPRRHRATLPSSPARTPTTGLFPEGDRLEAHDEVRPTAMRLPPRSFPASRPLLRMDLQSPGQDGQREAQLASRPALSGRHQTAPQTQGHAGQDGAPLANRFSSPGEASREYRLTSGCAAWSHYRLFSALRLPTVAYPACSPSLAPHRPPSGSRSDEKSGLAPEDSTKRRWRAARPSMPTGSRDVAAFLAAVRAMPVRCQPPRKVRQRPSTRRRSPFGRHTLWNSRPAPDGRAGRVPSPIAGQSEHRGGGRRLFPSSSPADCDSSSTRVSSKLLEQYTAVVRADLPLGPHHVPRCPWPAPSHTAENRCGGSQKNEACSGWFQVHRRGPVRAHSVFLSDGSGAILHCNAAGDRGLVAGEWQCKRHHCRSSGDHPRRRHLRARRGW